MRLFALVLSLTFASCGLFTTKDRIYGPASYLEEVGIHAELQKPGIEGLGKTIQQYQSQTDLAAKQQLRNEVVAMLIAGVDRNYEAFLDDTYVTRATWATVLDVGALGLASASVLTAHKATSELLAATGAGFVATRSIVDLNWYYEQTIPILIQKMERLRAAELDSLRAKFLKSPIEWPLGLAVRDVNAYYLAGTWTKALAELLADDRPKHRGEATVALDGKQLRLTMPSHKSQTVHLFVSHQKGYSSHEVQLDVDGKAVLDLSPKLDGVTKFTVAIVELGASYEFDVPTQAPGPAPKPQ